MAQATFALFVPEHGGGALRIGYRALNYAVMAGKRRECVCGGELSVCDCGAITCTEAGCDQPRAFDVCTYRATYYQPAEYEARCTDCAVDPDEGPDPDWEYEYRRDEGLLDRW